MVTDLPEFSDLKIVTQQNLMNKFIGNLLFWVESFPRKIFYTCAVLSRIYDVYFYKKCRLLEKELEKYDVYFSPFTPPCDEIRNSKKIKRFSCIQDIIPVVENDTEKSFIPKWHHKLYKNINGEDFYFAISEYTRDDVLKYFGQVKPENIVTAHLGADEKFFPCTDYEKIRKVKTKYNIPNDYSYILSLCTLGKRKNIPFLIKAYAEFIKLHKEEKICLVLAGGKWKKFEKELKESLKGLDKKSIIQTGYVNDEDLPYLLSGAKVFVFPSLYEGFGLPVLEAMQCGCPVIVSNLTSLPEVVGDAGILINVCGENSQANLVTELEKMCFDNNFRNEYAGKALDQAKLFSWQKCARIITENIKKRVFSEN